MTSRGRSGRPPRSMPRHHDCLLRAHQASPPVAVQLPCAEPVWSKAARGGNVRAWSRRYRSGMPHFVVNEMTACLERVLFPCIAAKHRDLQRIPFVRLRVEDDRAHCFAPSGSHGFQTMRATIKQNRNARKPHEGQHAVSPSFNKPRLECGAMFSKCLLPALCRKRTVRNLL